MAYETYSSNMNLVLPSVGQTSGSQYATDINASLTIIDQHNHSSGSGVQITPSGLNINSDLTFNSQNATSLRSVRFTSQSVALSDSSDLGCLFEVGADLYYRDGNGNSVRITQSGNVAGSAGSISGLSSPASATYVSGSSTFVWQSAANTSANMDAASLVLRNATASSYGLTLNPPNAMAANYSLTLPSLPAGTSFVTLSAAGAISGSISTSGGIALANMGANSVDTSQLVDLSVSTAKIAALAVTGAKVAAATLTGAKLVSSPNFSGTAQSNSLNLVTVNTNTQGALKLLYGGVTSGGAAQTGGYSVSKGGVGIYTVTFSTAFSTIPRVVISGSQNTGNPTIVNVFAQSTTAFTVNTYNAGFGLADNAFDFIAVGT